MAAWDPHVVGRTGAFATNVLEAASVSIGRIGDYDAVREAASRTLRESLRHAGDPETVARLVLRVAQARSRRLRYPAGWEARFLPYLKVLAPQRLVDRLLRRGYGLHAS